MVLESFGNRKVEERLYDVGVAGMTPAPLPYRHGAQANCVIAVAGMEGALPCPWSVGLVDVPVIAVPTNVRGYGASFGGLAALLAMLNSCASGISVVNIGNGFGAAYRPTWSTRWLQG